MSQIQLIKCAKNGIGKIACLSEMRVGVARLISRVSAATLCHLFGHTPDNKKVAVFYKTGLNKYIYYYVLFWDHASARCFKHLQEN